MNEQIKTLIKDCTEYVTITTLHGLDIIDTHFDKEKFAELIVRECMSLCQECIDDGCVEAEEPMRKIKTHFGVE